MKSVTRTLYRKYRIIWNREHIVSLLFGLFLFGIALVAQNIANVYVGSLNGEPVGDLLLNNLPTVDIDILIVQGALILTAIATMLVLLRPSYIAFAIKSVSLFIIIRSFFISLTHLGINPYQLELNPQSFGFSLYDLLFYAEGDFFFSGHTGLPYLLALIFWRSKFWRYFFILSSITLGTSVLLAHVHYSIDVFAAPFITYGIYRLSRIFFAKDYKLAMHSHEL